MNNAELFARGNLINQTIKINSLHAEVKRNGKYAFFLSLFDHCTTKGKLESNHFSLFNKNWQISVKCAIFESIEK